MSTSNKNMTNTNRNKLGVIILGNTGVGKSFLVNILLNKEILKKNYCNQSLTRQTECQEITFGDYQYTTFDTPGLIEIDQVKNSELSYTSSLVFFRDALT